MSTQTQGGRGAPVKPYRRRKAVPDLNMPPSGGRFDEGTSAQAAPPLVVHAGEQTQSVRLTMIDVEALEDDDDVVESSATAFTEARNNALRTGRRPVPVPVVVDVDLDSGRTNGLPQNNHNKRRRSGPCINIDDSNNSRRKTVQSPPPPPPPPPPEPVFSCPICMGPFLEATATKCGHIFCLPCIKKALETSKSPICPTCRTKVSKRGLIRVFLPTTS